mmetsp:Transcript_10269/g.17271  ORF Transcript_10269/g.17271 Transcript_10269/m.17271 type:complete len:98 (+) Transcript_10269:266-559(+)
MAMGQFPPGHANHLQGSGNGSGNHTAISGGRKPTADSHAYTLYKPNKQNNRGKFSNGGGSLGGEQVDMSYENGYLNGGGNKQLMIDKQQSNVIYANQ